MLHGFPVALPGLAALALGFLAFMIAVIVARIRRGAGERAPGRRSPRSMLGIGVQCLAYWATAASPGAVTLDPMSALALLEAAAIALLMAAAVALFVWATRVMGRNWSIVARTRSDHELVTSGPFAYLRHPIYAAMALLLLALAIAMGSEVRLIVTLPLFALGTWLRVAEEERLLRAAFGTEYEAYAARVRRFLPGLW